MKLNWGLKIALVYGGFVVLIMTLVYGASRQHFDLVSKDYYDAEVAYQKVIDAGKNQASLSAPVSLHANERAIIIDFPENFKGKMLKGDIKFYSPVNSAWDKDIVLSAVNNSMSVSRTELQKTRYTAKISFEAEGKKYYQESEINLYQ